MSLALLVGMATAFAQQKQQRRRPATARKSQAKDSRVYLVHADVLHYDQMKNPDATILNGKVHFTHQGARLYCDSAYFYEASNSFEAFGHVKVIPFRCSAIMPIMMVTSRWHVPAIMWC